MDQPSWFRSLELAAQPVFALRQGTVCFVNSAAESLGVRTGLTLYQFLLAKDYPIPSAFVSRFDCELRGVPYLARSILQDEYAVYFLEPKETDSSERGFPGRVLAHTSASIRRSIHEILFSFSELYEQLTRDEDPAALRNASLTMRGVYQLERVADNLDCLQKLRTEGYTPSFETLDLSQLFGALASKAAELLHCSDVTLEYKLPAGLRGVSDRKLLSLIFWNLISNAAADCEDRKIFFTLRKSGDAAVELCVENRSASPFLELSRLFERYAAGMDESLTQQGTGVGLSVVSAAAKALGGTLLLSQTNERKVRALVSINVAPRQEYLLRSELLMPERSIDEGLVGLAAVLPYEAYDIRDLL